MLTVCQAHPHHLHSLSLSAALTLSLPVGAGHVAAASRRVVAASDTETLELTEENVEIVLDEVRVGGALRVQSQPSWQAHVWRDALPAGV